jgi:hypothetical protein
LLEHIPPLLPVEARAADGPFSEEGARKGYAIDAFGVTRMLRIFVGLFVLFATWYFQLPVLFYLFGGVILFAAIRDRCPIWQAISPRLASLVQRMLPSQKTNPS